MKHNLFIIITTFLLALAVAIYLQLEYPARQLVVSAKCMNETPAQMFYNIGQGFNEKDSAHYCWLDSDEFQDAIFDLPKSTIKQLRLDPFLNNGSIKIKDAYIIQNNVRLIDFNLSKQILLLKDLYIQSSGETELSLTNSENSTDPMIHFKLKNKIYPWSLQNLSLIDLIFDALILLLVLAPILWSLDAYHVEKKGNHIFFRSDNRLVKLDLGKSHTRIPKKYYKDAPKKVILEATKRIKRGEHWRSVLTDLLKEKNDWLLQIITSNLRNKFIDEKSFSKEDFILDIGAGWGQFSIPLAKTNRVCSVEPTPEKIEFIKTVAKQENVEENIFFLGADYLQLQFDTKFDCILCIGVLEWIGSFRDDLEPFEMQVSFLNKARKDLKKNGTMIIGIENRIGLKYLLGAADDHTGIPHISYFDYHRARKKFNEKTNKELKCFTYCLGEYTNMLKKSGFSKIQFFVALPDYKLPQKIFPINGEACAFNDFLKTGKMIKEHSGTDGSELPFQELLQSTYRTLALENLAHHFAPSFFIEAS